MRIEMVLLHKAVHIEMLGWNLNFHMEGASRYS